MADNPASLMAGVEMIDVEHLETPTGGKIFLGRCAGDDEHIVFFAHINVIDVPELIEALNAAALKFTKTEGSA